jgi:pSer/pThr/pTyr-binding forkhead associated (FHA) protein
MHVRHEGRCIHDKLLPILGCDACAHTFHPLIVQHNSVSICIESECMTWLEYNEALQELREDSEVVVGTGAQATWRLRRADLMPRHFIVMTANDRATIRPFSSDTVVTINGRQLSMGSWELQDGDLIAAGSGEFRFWQSTPGESRSETKSPASGHLVDAQRQAALPLQRVSTGIGSDESNALVLETADASAFHAEVRREAGGHVLRVPKSSLVKLNGRMVSSPLLLSEGDQIEIGDLRLGYTRAPLPEGVVSTPLHRITSEEAVVVPASAPRRLRTSSVGDLSSAVTMRSPMRAVAFVSSVIAAVAIATLVFLHRGP